MRARGSGVRRLGDATIDANCAWACHGRRARAGARRVLVRFGLEQRDIRRSQVRGARTRKPDWTTYSGNKNEFTLRPVTAADLVGPDGQCAPAAGCGRGRARTSRCCRRARRRSRAAIVLQMTECDVVRRAGLAEKVDLGAGERGERAVVLTFTRGPWPGIYRFAGGRLVSIERLPGPAPAARQKPSAKSAKKPIGHLTL